MGVASIADWDYAVSGCTKRGHGAHTVLSNPSSSNSRGRLTIDPSVSLVGHPVLIYATRHGNHMSASLAVPTWVCVRAFLRTHQIAIVAVLAQMLVAQMAFHICY